MLARSTHDFEVGDVVVVYVTIFIEASQADDASMPNGGEAHIVCAVAVRTTNAVLVLPSRLKSKFRRHLLRHNLSSIPHDLRPKL